MKARNVFLLIIFCLCGKLFSTEEPFQLLFKQAQEIQIAQQTIPLAGSFTKDGYWVYGQQGLSLPAATLLSEEAGTVLFRFRMLPPESELLIPRYLLTLRTASRLAVGFTVFGGQKPRLNFSFSDRDKTMRFQSQESLNYNQEYSAAFSYDSKTIRVFLDGKLVSEAAQPLPVRNIRNLNIGPYKDGWIAPKSWGDDCQARELRVWKRALAPAEIAQLCGVEFTPLSKSQPPLLTVPRLTGVAPVIDGELTEKSWDFAASMPWLIYGNAKEKSGELPPHRFAMTYDDTNFYLGFNSIFPGGAAIQAGGLRKDNHEGEVWGTESFEFYITIGERRYRFGGNVAGGYVEWLGVNSKWNGEWTYKTTLKMRIDDSQLWQGEIAIPWKTLGLTAPPKESVRFNFCRSWKIPGVEPVSSLNLIGGTYENPEEHVDLTFVEESPVLQILGQNNPNLGDYQHELALAAGAGGALRYQLQLGHLDGSSTALPLLDRVFQLQAGEYFTEKLNVPINNPGYDCLIYTLSRGSKVFMRELVPFHLVEEYFTLQKLFLSERIVIKARLPMLQSQFGADFAGSIVITAPDRQVIFNEKLQAGELTVPFPRKRQAGEYRIELVNNRDGKKIYSQNINYPGIGEWESMSFDQERIIPPFSPIKYKQGTDTLQVEPWGRSYVWEKSLFPTQISSQETALLAAPVKLIADGIEFQNVSLQIDKTAAHRGELAAQSENDTCKLTEKSWIEYDGVLWNKIQISAKKELKNLQLLIKLPASIAKYMHASGGSAWGSRITMELPMGESLVRYYPVLWFGMEDKGLCFFTETRKNWKAPIQQTFRIVKDAQHTSIAVNLATHLAAGEVFQFEFGLLASPVRPLPVNYPLNTLGWSYASPLNRLGHSPTTDITYLTLPGNSGDLGSFFGDQDNEGGRLRAAALSAELARIKPFGGRPIPYTCAMYLSENYPEVAAYKEEWGSQPEIAMDYDHTGHFVYGCCPSTGANDFFVYRYKKMLERFDLGGIYFDFGLIGECSNKLHGCDQRYPILAMREFYRRIALVQLEAGIKDPILVIHNTDHVQLPALTFTTHLLNGEQVRQASSSILHNKKDVLDTYNLDIFAIELATLPFGITNSVYFPMDKLSAQYGGDEEDEPYKFRQTKAALAAVLPHNTIPCLWRSHHGIYDKIIRYYDQFGVPKAQFYGYWQKPARLLKGNNVIISVYRHASEAKILAVIGHIGKEHTDQEVDISFDLSKLGISRLSKAVDLMTAPDPDYNLLEELMKKYRVPRVRAPLSLGDFGTKVISLQDNILKLQLPYHSFAIVELSE